MIPDNPNISWASLMISALLILDVSTKIGEFHSVWSKDGCPTCVQSRQYFGFASGDNWCGLGHSLSINSDAAYEGCRLLNDARSGRNFKVRSGTLGMLISIAHYFTPALQAIKIIALFTIVCA